MGTTWIWQVPSLEDAPLALRNRRHSLVTLDPEVPRVSVYCRDARWHEPPWLCGSFTLEERFASWGSSPYYPTGDGHGLFIGYPTVELDGDAPVQLASDMDLDDEDDLAALAAFSAPSLRIRFALQCGDLSGHRLRKVARSDGPIQSVLQKLWHSGVPEISLGALAAKF